ncbi:putative RNA binding protein Rnp24 [Aspergillus saccharolyticus JOP 1030-1]|uniref:Nuclear localization sequence binding protein n=1 Tax=Aspergillus saccharolyticus JOP 1030-1 TaxID=1450539 RepID=A0A318ZKC7_9EURO|nr:nuclear localization sequence binding protein [Aspergillus saccharolyticus JOP 1030-1]PYH45013.1 nuclear localization sequence binding protein [Aspergillus saccharolyticus JOP 1030-1]
MASIGEENQKKRKLTDVEEIEIDISAPEPPSKKALRKAKKAATAKPSESTTETEGVAAVEKPTAAPSKRSEYGVWIGNLAFSVTKDDLRTFFTSNCSFAETTITRIHMPKGAEKSGKSQNKGFAYVDFSTQKAAEEAIGLSEQLLTGRRVLIKDAKSFAGRPDKPKEDGQKAGSAASGHPPSKRIFVGNLSFDTTKEAIEEHFAPCGVVANVHVATFQDSGKCKGYAWVVFEDLAAAEAAVKGYVLVKEDDEEEDESESDSEKRKKPQKPRQRKVWVNFLLGRRLRMEFAEDATTRYKKRFGKDGEGKKNNSSETVDAESGDFEATEEQPRQARPPRTKQAKPEYTRYDQDTVQKLSGAIVESQGKKTTFD